MHKSNFILVASAETRRHFVSHKNSLHIFFLMQKASSSQTRGHWCALSAALTKWTMNHDKGTTKARRKSHSRLFLTCWILLQWVEVASGETANPKHDEIAVNEDSLAVEEQETNRKRHLMDRNNYKFRSNTKNAKNMNVFKMNVMRGTNQSKTRHFVSLTKKSP